MNWTLVKNNSIIISPRSWSAQIFSKNLALQGINVTLPVKEPSEAILFDEYRLLPVQYVTPVLDENEVIDGISYEVSYLFVMGTYGKRAKTESELNPVDSPQDIKRKQLENKYLEATKSLLQLAGETVPDGVWPKLEDVEFEQKAIIAVTNNAAMTSLVLSTLNYTFFQLKLINWAWENIQYRPEVA